jgi:hypothetical protein
MQYAFSLPTKSDKVPTGSEWIHEIKHDGYRMVVVRDNDRVRLISRGGRDWADRFPLVVSAALKLLELQFAIDGEVVVLDKEGNPTSMLCPHAATTSMRSFTRSTCYRETARTSARFRSHSAKQASRSSSLIRSTGFSLRSTSGAILDPFYFRSPAICDSRALSRSTWTVRTVPADANTGSRSRTPRTRLTAG